MNLSKNFTKQEAIEWAKWQGMSAKDTAYCIKLATENWNPQVEEEARKIAAELQLIRDEVNKAFPQYLGKIGVRPLSWFRPVEWELYRGRSGKGQHPTGNAVDFVFVNISDKDYPILMEWAWKRLQKWNGGLARLYKNKRWSFIHIDLGRKRRWEY